MSHPRAKILQNLVYVTLWPLFFIIFYNDLPSSLSCTLDAFADDSTMTVTDKSTEEIGVKMTDNCELASDWMVRNKLKLSADRPT